MNDFFINTYMYLWRLILIAIEPFTIGILEIDINKTWNIILEKD